MALSIEQFAKALVAAGLSTTDDVKTYWSALAPDQRPKDAAAFASRLVKSDKLTPYQAQVLLSGSQAPLVMGDYVILAQIGAGGMGQVFKAQHRRMERIVAIKLLPEALSKDAAAVQRFHREVKAAAKLLHPNIVTAFDAGESQGRQYLVMEYVEGRDLATVVGKEGPLAVDRAVNYVRQAAKGLAFAHAKGVIHRDIKPANLLLDNEGTVKILDMGLARFDEAGAASKAGLTQSGQVMGTVDYMAPEQAFDVHSVDGRADIYSLGCTLYRLLTGRNLYEGESIVAKLMAHQSQPIPALATRRRDAPPEVVEIFERMVAKQADSRFPTMAEVEAALAALDPSASPGGSIAPREPDSGVRQLLEAINRPATKPSATKTKTTEQQYSPTISVSHAQIGTDAVPEQSIQLARDSGAKLNRPRERRASFWLRPPVLIGGGLGALAFLMLALLGLWHAWSGRQVTKVDVPDGGKATVQKKASSGDKSTTTGGVPPAGGGDFALDFDGKQAYVETPLRLGSEPRLTVEAWCVPRGETRQIVVCNFEGSGCGLYFDQRFPRFGGFPESGNVAELRAPAVVTPNHRVHLAGVLDEKEVRLYVNGKLAARSDFKGPFKVFPVAFMIGANPGSQVIEFFDGTIDHVRISKSVRYLDDFAPANRFEADANTLLLYHFDEGSGDVLKDSSGNGRHGKIFGAKWVRVNESQSAPPPSGDFALQFNGTDYVDLPTLKYDASEPITIEATAGLVGTTATEAIIGSAVMSGDVTGAALFQKPGIVGWLIQTGRNQEETTAASDSGTYHLAGQWDRSTLRLFVDGKLVAEKPYAARPGAQSSVRNFVIGAQKTFDGLARFPFRGQLDEIRVSKVARYDKGYVPVSRLESDKDTIALYHFDEGTGDVLRDSSGHGHHGKIVGAKWVPVVHLWRDDPGYAAWAKELAALSPDDQITRVMAKMKERNPTMRNSKVFGQKIAGKDVTELAFLADDVQDLSPLQALKGLKYLMLNVPYGHETECDLSGLRGMALTRLDANHVLMKDISPLAGMPLETLDIAENPLTDISVLKTLPQLKNLTLKYDRARDEAVLHSLSGLKSINNKTVDEFWKSVAPSGPAAPKRVFASDEWIDVIPLIDPALDKSPAGDRIGKNDWRVDKGELRYFGDDKVGILYFPVRVRGRSLEWEIEFTRTSGDGCLLNTHIPVPGGFVPISFQNGGMVMKSVLLSNEYQLGKGQRQKLRIRALHEGTNDTVDVFVNEKSAGHWSGELAKLQVTAAANELHDPSQFNGLYISGKADFTFHAIRLRMLGGDTAELVRPSDFPALGPWRSLFNRKDLSGFPGRWDPKKGGHAEIVTEDGSPAIRISGLALETAPYSNFHLRFEAKADEKFTHNGVQLFTPTKIPGKYVAFGGWLHDAMRQANPMLYVSGGNCSYREAALQGGQVVATGEPSQEPKSIGMRVVPAGPWLHMEIIRLDDSLVYVVNGKVAGAVSKLRDTSSGQPEPIGPIKTRFYGDEEGPLFLRNVEIRDISALPPELTASATFTNSLGMEFVRVPAGKSWLGGGGGTLGTQVRLIDDFYLGKYEVTQAQWERLMPVNRSWASRTGGGRDVVKTLSDDNLKRLPVENVSWDDCQEFIKRLNEQAKDAGWEYRLPTGAEWEYACRGGPPGDQAESAFHYYLDKPGNEILVAQANFKSPGDLKRPREVGSYAPNRLGLYDMHGNVWEWCHDAETDKDGTAKHIERGGGWNFDATSCRAATRLAIASSSRFDSLGLRLARVRVPVVGSPGTELEFAL